MSKTCPACDGTGDQPQRGYMPRAAICMDCDGTGEVLQCPKCKAMCPAPYLEEQPGGLCESCVEELRGEGWDYDQIFEYKGEDNGE